MRNEAFSDWVPEYEAIVEPIAHLAAVLGRSGAGDELRLVLDAVQGLYVEAHREQAGYTPVSDHLPKCPPLQLQAVAQQDDPQPGCGWRRFQGIAQ